jgi:hypothetical protein
MKTKTVLTIASAAVAAAAIGYFIGKDKAHKEIVKRLVERKAFEKYNEKNIYAANICAEDEEEN